METTAVEWYFKQMQLKEQFTQEEFDTITNQAKEMEKQQIIDACNQEECFGSYGYGIHEDITKGEEYYNVKFNKQVK